jgi:hypothetical protein
MKSVVVWSGSWCASCFFTGTGGRHLHTDNNTPAPNPGKFSFKKTLQLIPAFMKLTEYEERCGLVR